MYVCVCCQFPALCTAYMRLVTYLAEIYPHKVCQLPEDLLKTLSASIELGLVKYPCTNVHKSQLTCIQSYYFFWLTQHEDILRDRGQTLHFKTFLGFKIIMFLTFVEIIGNYPKIYKADSPPCGVTTWCMLSKTAVWSRFSHDVGVEFWCNI